MCLVLLNHLLMDSHHNVVEKIHECPRCESSVCGMCFGFSFLGIPCDCPICGLTLVSSPLLARSYHHLFPMSDFNVEENGKGKQCFACMVEGENEWFRHGKCGRLFCGDCEGFLQEVLHNCPGCL